MDRNSKSNYHKRKYYQQLGLTTSNRRVVQPQRTISRVPRIVNPPHFAQNDFDSSAPFVTQKSQPQLHTLEQPLRIYKFQGTVALLSGFVAVMAAAGLVTLLVTVVCKMKPSRKQQAKDNSDLSACKPIKDIFLEDMEVAQTPVFGAPAPKHINFSVREYKQAVQNK